MDRELVLGDEFEATVIRIPPETLSDIAQDSAIAIGSTDAAEALATREPQ